MPTKHRKTGESERVIDRREKVWELRKSGLSIRAIAKAVNYSRSTVQEDLATELKRRSQETADAVAYYRTMHLEELSGLRSRLMQLIFSPGDQETKPDLKAIDRLLRVQEREAALLGIDAPKEQRVTGPDGGPFTIRIVDENGPQIGDRIIIDASDVGLSETALQLIGDGLKTAATLSVTEQSTDGDQGEDQDEDDDGEAYDDDDE